MELDVDGNATGNAGPAGRGGAACRLRRFRRGEDGSLLIFSLFILVAMLMIAGMAVDLMNTETQRARLQGTLDRAVLAGASRDQSLDNEAVVRDYFKKAGLDAYLSSVDVTKDPTGTTVEASAYMEVKTYFMNLLGITTLSAPASGTAEERLSDVEISLILDISGSMASRSSSSGNTKLYDLQQAANEFVELMQCNADPGTGACTVEANSVSISLVPYAEQVLVGESLIRQFNVTNEHTYSSCADFSLADYANTAISLSEPLQRAGNQDAWTSSWYTNAYDQNRTCRTDSYRTIVPYENSYTELRKRINALRAGGYTSIDLAMKWGTALLDPAFRPVVTALSSGPSALIDPAFAGRPFDYSRPSTQKVIVLMTDGENTQQSALKDGYREGPSPFWKNPADGRISVYNASTGRYYYPHNGTWNDEPYDGSGCYYSWWYGWVCSGATGTPVQMSYPELWQEFNVNYFKRFSWLGNPVDVYGYSDKNTRLDAICTAAKAKGIEVFTIGFETSSASSAIMEKCASSPAHNFDVDGLNIDNAFASIARQIQQLRLTN